MRRRFAIAVVLVLAVPAAADSPAPPVTRQFMRQLANGTIDSASLVDPTKGIETIVYTVSEAEPPETRSAKRVCGAAAIRVLATRRTWLREAIDSGDLFTCRNKPNPVCTAGVAGEFSSQTEWVFRPSAAGALVLEALITTNIVYKPKNEARVVARLRARLAGGTCTP